MRLIQLQTLGNQSNLKMRLARPILDEKGTILVGKGVELTSFIVNRLLNLGILSAYVDDGLTNDIIVPEIVSQETTMKTISFIHKTMQEAANSKNFSKYFQTPKFTKKIQELFRIIIDEIQQNSSVMVSLANIYSTDEFLYHHSFNVTMMALMIGLKLKLSEKQMMDLGIGTILHDIGKMTIDPVILNKPDKLTPQEFEIMKTHTTNGFEILRNQGDISAAAAQIALLHHERFDGTGYPRGIPGKEQHIFGRIVALADVYEALTANRIYRRGYLPHQAFEYILGGGGSHFDPVIVDVFVKTIAVYPIGTEVTLNTGEKAIVTGVDSTCPHRPNVRVLFDANGNLLHTAYDIRLVENLTCMIVDTNVEGMSQTFQSAVQ
ncbi:HD-GYP domain-containing protein [Fodinisporobacter ferrooxydans]|uniref:HD-GYP domain-containing protein n=1 Tax=Fodinisporobacter ferrooxydans TaxID=2901836 RepID=A0ABY4CN54_9BACL|nr:HD-GYP domain-containing protein [Alicyclobacillaceae bacterium MYW30-H2]